MLFNNMDLQNNISTSPVKKEVKMVKLQWVNRLDKKKKTPTKSPLKYNLRSRKIQTPKTILSPLKENHIQKKINSYFIKTPNNNNNYKKLEKSPIKFLDKNDTDLYLSPSARLDSKVPKVEDILRAREQEKKLKEIHAIIEASSKRFLQNLEESSEQNNSFEIEENNIDIKDCKHLNLKQISRKFKKDLKYLDDLFYGRVYNKRLELFKKDTPLNNGTKNDLRINETTSVFTQDQLLHIISLFRDRYDNGNMYKYSDLYFKVLLPEYCLKIFCDVYKMSNETALEYLKKIPVRDIFE